MRWKITFEHLASFTARERRTGWLKEAAGTAVVCALAAGGNMAETARRGERSWNDRHRSLRGNRLRLSCREADNTPPPCGFLSSLSREDGSRSRADDSASRRFTRRVKKKGGSSRASDRGTAHLTRLFEVRLFRWRPDSVVRASRVIPVTSIDRASGAEFRGRSISQRHKAYPERTLSYAPWKYPRGRIRRERDYRADILWKTKILRGYISFDAAFHEYRLTTSGIFRGNISLKNICLKKGSVFTRRTAREYDIRQDLDNVDVRLMTREYILNVASRRVLRVVLKCERLKLHYNLYECMQSRRLIFVFLWTNLRFAITPRTHQFDDIGIYYVIISG